MASWTYTLENEGEPDDRQRLFKKRTSTEDVFETVTDQTESMKPKDVEQQDRLTRYLKNLDVD